MVTPNKELIGAVCGTSVSAVGTGLQTSEVLQIISLVLTIIGSLITISMAIISWWKKAKADGKITSDEIRKQYKIFCQNEGLIELADNIWSQLLKQRYACKSCTISEKSGFNERRIRGYRGISFKKKLEPNSEMPIFDWR